jgi:hypothetical protein
MTSSSRVGSFVLLLAACWLSAMAVAFAQDTPAADPPAEKPAVPLVPPPPTPSPEAKPSAAPASPASPVPPLSPLSPLSPPSPPAGAGPAPVEIQGPGPGGPSLDLQRRQPGPNALPSALRALKRLSREEIQASTSDSFSIYVLRDNERTLVLDFPNIREQARMFARLILFIERAGTSKTRVMSVPEVQRWLTDNAVTIDTLTVGNNMKTGELARFFNSARFQGEPITVHEQRLYDSLLQRQLLREEESGVAVVDPERVVVSVPQVSSVSGCAACSVSAAQRAVILQHELAHARFATDTVYQSYVLWFWSNAMSLVQRDKFQRFFRTRGYDPTIRELCANEMQAFLMHTPDPRMFSPADVGMTDSEIAELRRRFQDGLAPKARAADDKPYQFE